MALAANDAADRVDQLTILTERLTDVVARQCQSFEQHRPQDAQALMEEAQWLANLYRHESSRVRADPGLSDTPFIMVTAESKTENVIAAKKAGVSNYIVKPFNAQTLKSKIDAVFPDAEAETAA